jgi:hypothetical protein
MDAHLRSRSLPSVASLAERTDLSEPTVRKAIDQLRATKWYVEPADTLFDEITYPKPPITHVYVPKELLLSKKVEVQASIVYGILMAKEHFTEGHFTYVSLSQLTHRNIKTMRRAVRNLRDTKWLRFDQENHWVPIYFQLLNPVKEFLATVVSDLRRPKFLGETLNQVYLRLIADSNKFLYGGYYGELINPGTGKPLQLDVYYPTHSVAFEFNGPQHETATEFMGFPSSFCD